MSKEITKAFILQQIEEKMGLREFEKDHFLFSETVIPIYNIEQHLTREAVEEKTTSITSTGGKWFMTAPPNERWIVHRYNIIFVTGSYKVAGLMVCRTSLADYIYLDLALNQTVSYSKNLPQPVVLQPGDALYINIDDYTSTGNLMLRVDVTIEEIR